MFCHQRLAFLQPLHCSLNARLAFPVILPKQIDAGIDLSKFPAWEIHPVMKLEVGLFCPHGNDKMICIRRDDSRDTGACRDTGKTAML
jgi:hypothetical protein